MKAKLLACLLLSALLMLAGCGAGETPAAETTEVQTDVHASESGQSFTVSTVEELEAALAADGPVASIDIVADLTLTSDCTVQYATEYYLNTAMTVAQGVTVTVGENGAFGDAWYTFDGDWSTKLGTIVNNGAIILENGGRLADMTVNNGTILVRDGGEMGAALENKSDGVITVESGGVMHTGQGAGTKNGGLLEIQSGASLTATMGGWIENSGRLVIDGEMDINGGEGGSFQDNGGEITGSGVIVIDGGDRCRLEEDSFSAFTGTLTVDGVQS